MLKNSEIITEFVQILDNMYKQGWDERNSGNMSQLLSEEILLPYQKELFRKEGGTTGGTFPGLAEKIILITATGKYFKNMVKNPEENLGIIKIDKTGKKFDVLWGFSNNGAPTSELPTHLATHQARLEVNPKQSIVIHSHATNVLAMTFIHENNDKEFTKTLWKMTTEGVVVFPDGVSVVPWMVCGTEEIGLETAKRMKDVRTVIWSMHGIFVAGDTLDDAFGLMETIEKAADRKSVV